MEISLLWILMCGDTKIEVMLKSAKKDHIRVSVMVVVVAVLEEPELAWVCWKAAVVVACSSAAVVVACSSAAGVGVCWLAWVFRRRVSWSRSGKRSFRWDLAYSLRWPAVCS